MEDEWTLELLKECFNLGIGQAAAAISQLTDKEVQLSAPAGSVSTLDQVLSEFIVDDWSVMNCVYQKCFGDVNGYALAIYPHHASVELIHQISKSNTPIKYFSELESEAMSEVGNIIINSCMDAICDQSGTSIGTHLPNFLSARGRVFANLGGIVRGNEPSVLLKISFNHVDSRLEGILAFVLVSEDLTPLLQGIAQTFEASMGE